jgi:DNA-binding LacI/PurR family transcriptional regulator
MSPAEKGSSRAVSSLAPERGRAPTVREVARIAGVSHVTVSLALRHDPRISDGTAQRVRMVARRLGYVPDPRVAELMGRLRLGRRQAGTSVIAFLGFVHPLYGARGSPTARRFFRGAEVRAAQLGYRLERFLIERDLSIERVAAILRARDIRGVLVSPLTEDAGTLHLECERLAVVAFGYTLRDPAVHRVCNHHGHTARLALEELTRRGYRRCALYLRSGFGVRVDDAWVAEYYRHWHAHHEAELPIPPVRGDAWDRADFHRWFREHRPDAVLTIHLPVLAWMEELGVRVPGKVGFVHLDWSREMGDVAGIDQQSEQVGTAALELVAAQLNQNDYGIPASPKTVFIESAWHEGRTARSVRRGV